MVGTTATSVPSKDRTADLARRNARRLVDAELRRTALPDMKTSSRQAQSGQFALWSMDAGCEVMQIAHARHSGMLAGAMTQALTRPSRARTARPAALWLPSGGFGHAG